jgi:hypothetical protein
MSIEFFHVLNSKIYLIISILIFFLSINLLHQNLDTKIYYFLSFGYLSLLFPGYNDQLMRNLKNIHTFPIVDSSQNPRHFLFNRQNWDYIHCHTFIYDTIAIVSFLHDCGTYILITLP